MGQTHWFYRSEDEWNTLVEQLKLKPCPHCKTVGALIRHGFLPGRDDTSPRRDIVRARRIFCNSRNKRRPGCGRTVSVWMADKIRRLQLAASTLWRFLRHAVTGTLADAIRRTPCHLCGRTLQRIWRRFSLGQSRIRVALATRGVPAALVSDRRPEAEVVAHLRDAFPDSQNPIADFQSKTGSFIV